MNSVDHDVNTNMWPARQALSNWALIVEVPGSEPESKKKAQ